MFATVISFPLSQIADTFSCLAKNLKKKSKFYQSNFLIKLGKISAGFPIFISVN